MTTTKPNRTGKARWRASGPLAEGTPVPYARQVAIRVWRPPPNMLRCESGIQRLRFPRGLCKPSFLGQALDLAESLPQAAKLDGLDLSTLARQRLAGAPKPVAHGTPASVGIAVGRVAFDVESASQFAAGGNPIILVRHDTSTEDVAGFAVSAGILTAIGGRTAHAALVARQMGKPCVVGVLGLRSTPPADAHGSQTPV